MAYRILSAALVACLAGLSAAQAADDPKVNDLIDAMDPACRNTPISQMTRAKLEECENIEKFISGPIEGLKRLRLRREAEEQRVAKPPCRTVLLYHKEGSDKPEVVKFGGPHCQ